MSSFISPVKPVDTAVSWNWNPAATFIAARNDAIARKQQEEQMVLDRWLQEQLLPLKVEQTKLELDKLRTSIEVQKAQASRYRSSLQQNTQNVIEGIHNGPPAMFDFSEGGMDINGFGYDAPNPNNPLLQIADGQPAKGLFDDLPPASAGPAPFRGAEPPEVVVQDTPQPNPDSRFNVLENTDWPTESMMADASSGVSDSGPSLKDFTALGAANAARAAVSGEYGSLTPNADAYRPKVSLSDPPKSGQKSEKPMTLAPLMRNLEQLRRVEEQADEILKTTGADDADIRQRTLDQLESFRQQFLQAGGAKYGIMDGETASALARLPTDKRIEVLRPALEQFQKGEIPTWTDSITKATSKPDKAADPVDVEIERLSKANEAILKSYPEGDVPPSAKTALSANASRLAQLTGAKPETKLDFYQNLLRRESVVASAKGRNASVAYPDGVTSDAPALTSDKFDAELGDIASRKAALFEDPEFLGNLKQLSTTGENKASAAQTKAAADEAAKTGIPFILDGKLAGAGGAVPKTLGGAANGSQPTKKGFKYFSDYTQEEIEALPPDKKARFLKERAESEQMRGGLVGSLRALGAAGKSVGDWALEGASNLR
jgi:hypothetical protein